MRAGEDPDCPLGRRTGGRGGALATTQGGGTQYPVLSTSEGAAFGSDLRHAVAFFIAVGVDDRYRDLVGPFEEA